MRAHVRINSTNQQENFFKLLFAFSDPFAETVGTFARDERDFALRIAALGRQRAGYEGFPGSW